MKCDRCLLAKDNFRQETVYFRLAKENFSGKMIRFHLAKGNFSGEMICFYLAKGNFSGEMIRFYLTKDNFCGEMICFYLAKGNFSGEMIRFYLTKDNFSGEIEISVIGIGSCSCAMRLLLRPLLHFFIYSIILFEGGLRLIFNKTHPRTNEDENPCNCNDLFGLFGFMYPLYNNHRSRKWKSQMWPNVTVGNVAVLQSNIP